MKVDITSHPQRHAHELRFEILDTDFWGLVNPRDFTGRVIDEVVAQIAAIVMQQVGPAILAALNSARGAAVEKEGK